MKIKLKDLLPNPYRHMKQYPLDRDKIRRLKTSITETTFWDNVLARPHPDKKGKYQLAYGHHRYVALREINKNVEIDIPIRVLDNAMMLRIMATENLEWDTSPAAINQTIQTVRDYLNAELVKCETWEEANVNKSINVLFASNRQFQQCKQEGVGQTTIKKFLGGNWKQWRIQTALEIIRGGESGLIDRKVVETIPTLRQAGQFCKELKKNKVSIPMQKDIANYIIKERVSKDNIPKTVRRLVSTTKKVSDGFYQAEKLVDEIKVTANKLSKNITELKSLVTKLGISELKGLKVFSAVQALSDLKGTISTFELKRELPCKRKKH